MRPAELWRHSSFRLAVGVTVVILTTLMLASGFGSLILALVAGLVLWRFSRLRCIGQVSQV